MGAGFQPIFLFSLKSPTVLEIPPFHFLTLGADRSYRETLFLSCTPLLLPLGGFSCPSTSLIFLYFGAHIDKLLCFWCKLPLSQCVWRGGCKFLVMAEICPGFYIFLKTGAFLFFSFKLSSFPTMKRDKSSFSQKQKKSTGSCEFLKSLVSDFLFNGETNYLHSSQMPLASCF